jgi:serine/threonine protein kinase/WD40 repeat protein
MDTGFRRVKELFIAAIERHNHADREEFLLEACGTETAIRRQVDALLARHEESSSFLDSTPPGPATTVGFPGADDQMPADETLSAGAVVGPYELVETIGEGGMGTVFLARQQEPVKRLVAVKLIKAGMDSRQVLARFEAERQALALMDHPNIARVLDAGAAPSGRPYFVMELVQGLPITRYCDEHKLPVLDRLTLFVDVCRAVQHAHQKGIIHRDLKPSNVLVAHCDGKPVVKVIDFGVAKAAGALSTDRSLFTGVGGVVGTPEYMSPEQAGLNNADVDTRSDVYSLGVMLYELLTGTTPVSHRRAKGTGLLEVLRLVREEEPARPSTRLSNGEGLAAIAAARGAAPTRLSKLVRGELDWIVMRALEKDRGRRYETATAFAEDIGRYLADEAVRACPPSAGYRLRRFARRNAGLLTTAAFVALALVLGTAGSLWQAMRATKATTDTRIQLNRAELAEASANHRLFDAKLAEARALQRSQRIGRRFDSLAAISEATRIARELDLPADHFLDLRNAAIASLALPDLRPVKQWPGLPPGSFTIAFDGTLSRYVRTNWQGVVSIRRVADDTDIVPLLPGSGSPSFVHFSHDGTYLAVHSLGRLKVWRVAEPEAVVVIDQPVSEYGCGGFSPDDLLFAIGHGDGSITVHDLATRKVVHRLPPRGRESCLAFHPDGRSLAVACDNAVEIRDLDTGQVLADSKYPTRVHHLAWHPDGDKLAVACHDSPVSLWDVAANRQTVVFEGIRNGGIHVAFNRTGDLLATTGWEGKLRLWDVRTGRQLSSMFGGYCAPRFSPDDRLLAALGPDGQLGLWEVAGGREYRTLVRPGSAGAGGNHFTAIHPDGRLLAVAVQSGVGFWDMNSGKELAFISLPGCASVVFDATSGALVTNGSRGLLRWPVQSDATSPGSVRVGPPERLPVAGPICHVACNRDGRVVAVSQFDGGSVLNTDKPDHPVRLAPHRDARYVAVSPDGRWVATGSHAGAGVKLWNSRTGEMIKKFSDDGSLVGFSPDGTWLAVNEGGWVLLWATDTWQPGQKIEGTFADFSSDGKLLAVSTGTGAMRLVDPATGREFARLDDPHQDRSSRTSFSPDGTRLVASNNDSLTVHVWDLREIREQLAPMGLDWDLPPYPPRVPNPIRLLRVEIIGQAGQE